MHCETVSKDVISDKSVEIPIGRADSILALQV